MAGAWFVIGHRCLEFGMDWYLAARYWFYAFPSYFSEVYYGAPPYTYFTQLSEHFSAGNPFTDRPALQPLLDAARTQAVVVTSYVPQLFPADEKGTVDFVRLTFAMFGTQLHSLLYLYLAILFVSISVFVVRFRREPTALVTAALSVAALYVGICALPITKEVYSVVNPRGVGSLSFIALLHLALVTSSQSRLGRRDIAGLFIQSAIIVFVVSMRSAETWQVLSLVAIAAVNIFPRAVTRGAEPSMLWRPWVVVMPVLALLGGYYAYQQVSYPQEYLSTNIRNKIFWHNVLIGFALHPEIAETYGLSLNDASVLAYVRNKAEGAWHPDAATIFLQPNETARYGMVKRFRDYDELCRRAVVELVTRHPGRVIALYAWYKPRMLARTLAYAAGWVHHDLNYYGIQDQGASLLTMDERREASAFYNPFAWLPMLIAGAALLAAGRDAVRAAFTGRVLLAAAVIAVFSLIPAFVTYPLVHVVVAGYITFTLLLYALIARLGVAVLDARRPLLSTLA